MAERIDDIRRMSVARRDAMAKSTEHKKPPVQIVTPEKKKKEPSIEILVGVFSVFSAIGHPTGLFTSQFGEGVPLCRDERY